MFVDFHDSVSVNVWAVELTDKDEIFVNETWYRQDELLVDLASTSEMFADKTCWADLELTHYELLLLRTFDYLKPNASADDIAVRFSEPFSTFKFLATALIKSQRLNGIDGFDTLVIKRPSEARITLEFKRTFVFDWNDYVPPKPAPKPTFQVVVDNTKRHV